MPPTLYIINGLYYSNMEDWCCFLSVWSVSVISVSSLPSLFFTGHRWSSQLELLRGQSIKHLCKWSSCFLYWFEHFALLQTIGRSRNGNYSQQLQKYSPDSFINSLSLMSCWVQRDFINFARRRHWQNLHYLGLLVHLTYVIHRFLYPC